MPQRSPTRLRVEALEDRSTPAALPNGFIETPIAAGISAATAMEVSPDGDLWVLEQTGNVKRFRPGSTTADVVADLSAVSLEDTPNTERGLLGIAFDPAYASNRTVYLYYTSNAGTIHNRVSKFTVDVSNPNDYSFIDTSTNPAVYDENPILDLETLTNTNHNGGAIHFNPADGKLYVAVGDGGVSGNAQLLTNRLGKILRINTDGTPAAGNPTTFPGISGSTSGLNQAIWAVGLRNPFTFTFQPGTNRMFINDVGQNAFEEINDGIAGRNYGWPDTEGFFNQTTFPNYTQPVYAYAHGTGAFQGFSITGGAFYNPSAVTFPPSYTGIYFYADYINNYINTFNPSTGTAQQFATGVSNPVDLKVLADGSLLYLARGTRQVVKVQFDPLVPPGVKPAVAAPADGRIPPTVVNPNTGVGRTANSPFAGFAGPVHVAAGDVDRDGTADIVYAAGEGGGPRVQVVSGATGQVIRDFYAYSPAFTGGVFVAVGDVNNDGYGDIITGAGPGGGPNVTVFSGRNLSVLANFYAYDPSFGGGVNVAAADLDGDRFAEIVTGAGAGGGPHVKVFDGRTFSTRASFFAFDPGLRSGVWVAAGDVRNSGRADLVFGAGPGGGPAVRVFDGRSLTEATPAFFAYAPGFTGGVRVAVGSVGGNGRLSLLTATGPGGGPHVKAFDVTTRAEVASFFATDPRYLGGVFVG